MIGFIQGKVIHSDEGVVLLENNGIGYEIVCSGALYAKLLTDGQGEAYTYLQVRDDGLTLFGFASLEEKKMFLHLVSVSGVGGKIGIDVLSAMNVVDFAVAIDSSEVERIVLELREKVSAQPAERDRAAGKAAEAPPRVSDREEDAVVGLMSLGYTRAESVRAVRAAVDGGADSIEEIIMTALRSM